MAATSLSKKISSINSRSHILTPGIINSDTVKEAKSSFIVV